MSGQVVQGSFPHGFSHRLNQPQQRAIQAHQQTLAAHQAARQGAVQRQPLAPPHWPHAQVAQPQGAGPYATPPLAHQRQMAPPHVAQSRAVPHPDQSLGSSGAVQTLTVQPHGNGSTFQLPLNLSNFGQGNGQPLPPQVKGKMESYFATSFSDVRIHVGPQASSIGALAFTHGSNLYFAPGQYNPNTPHGQQLLGHELTHVMQ